MDSDNSSGYYGIFIFFDLRDVRFVYMKMSNTDNNTSENDNNNTYIHKHYKYMLL